MSTDNKVKQYNKIAQQQKPADGAQEETTEKRRGPVITSEVIVHKKSMGQRIKDTLLGTDGLFGYLGGEIIKPAIKNIIADSFTSGIHMILFPNSQTPLTRRNDVPFYNNRGVVGQRAGYTNYGNKYNAVDIPDNRAVNVRSSNRISDYVIKTRQEAMSVLTLLINDATAYGVVTVADYYDMLGVLSNYTDHAYGWDDQLIRQATVTPVRDGYILNLPKPVVV